jgi:hypothetical protein
MNFGSLSRGNGRGSFSDRPALRFAQKRSAYGLAGRTSGQSDRKNEIPGENDQLQQAFLDQTH